MAKKIRKAKTDGGMMPETLEEMEERPEVKNLIGIYAALSNKSQADIVTGPHTRHFSSAGGRNSRPGSIGCPPHYWFYRNLI